MKKPKELQKKGKINPEKRKDQISATFRRTFDQLTNKYEPYYSVEYLKMGNQVKILIWLLNLSEDIEID